MIHQLYPASCWEWRAKGRRGPCPQGSKNLEDIFSFCLRVCVCVSVISEYLCMCMFMCLCACGNQRKDVRCPVSRAPPSSFVAGSLNKPGAKLADCKPQGEPNVPTPTELEFYAFTATLRAHENWGFELRSSCLLSKCLLTTDICP